MTSSNSFYVDTSVIVARYKPADPLHREAEKLLQGKGARLYVSPVSLLELYSVLSRVRDELESPLLEEPILETLITFIVQDCKLSILSQSRIVERRLAGQTLTIPLEYHLAMRYADRMKLRTLDMLHLAWAHIHGVNRFVTGDEEILERSKTIKEIFKVKTLHPREIT